MHSCLIEGISIAMTDLGWRGGGLKRWLLLVALMGGCGPAPQPVHQERPAEESRKEERREERRERRKEDREGAPDQGGAVGNAGIGGAGGAYDLERDEQLGGHTLRKHVGRSDEQLRERLEQEPNISAASTWTNRELAEETVAAALRDQAGRISQWEARGERRANLALHYDAGREIGRSLPRGTAQTVPCTAAVIVLKANGGGFYVLTTYPEAAR